jgi:hypothetical protein
VASEIATYYGVPENVGKGIVRKMRNRFIQRIADERFTSLRWIVLQGKHAVKQSNENHQVFLGYSQWSFRQVFWWYGRLDR